MARPKAYIAIGHGTKPNGRHDPGAVNKKAKLTEHELAAKVVTSVVLGLKRSGVGPLVVEHNGRDPDYRGSVTAANKSKAEVAIEVHFNAGGGKGAECWVAGSSDAKTLATRIMRYLAVVAGTRKPGVKTSSKFWFTRGTTMPAVIVECDFIDGPNVKKLADDNHLAAMGEQIAQGICSYFKVRYKKKGC